MDLTEEQAGYLRYLVRQDMRKKARNRRSSTEKFGEQYDPTRHDAKVALQRATYTALGGDPDNVTNVAWPASPAG